MDDTDLFARIAALIEAEPRLRGAFSADPQLLWLPSATGPKKRSLFVGLFVVEKLLKRQALASVCTRVLETLNANKILAAADGVELMLCVSRGGTMERVLRLTVQASAYATAELLTPDDLNNPKPMDGVGCTLFRRTFS